MSGQPKLNVVTITEEDGTVIETFVTSASASEIRARLHLAFDTWDSREEAEEEWESEQEDLDLEDDENGIDWDEDEDEDEKEE